MKVDILGINYQIKEENVIDENIDCLGLIEYKKQLITIKQGLKEDIRKETIIHEIIHGILEHSGRADLQKKEDLINGLSNSIYQVFSRNKELTTYLFSKERSIKW